MKPLLTVLAALLLALSALGQQSFNSITIIPTTSPSTGAPTAPGTIVWRDINVPPNYITLTIPTSLSAPYVITLPSAPSIGCVVSDAFGNWAIDATCTGSSGSGLWSITGNNVYLSNTSYSVQSLLFEDQTATTGHTNVTIQGGAGQGANDLFDIITHGGAQIFKVQSGGGGGATETENILPLVNAAYNLGSNSFYWNAGYFDQVKTNFLGTLFASDIQVTTNFDPNVSGSYNLGSTSLLWQDLYAESLGDSTHHILTSWLALLSVDNVASNLLPYATNTYNIGSPSQSWNAGYFNTILPYSPGSGTSVGSLTEYWSDVYSNNVITGSLSVFPGGPPNSAILITGYLTPAMGSAYNLGTASNPWEYLYDVYIGDSSHPILSGYFTGLSVSALTVTTSCTGCNPTDMMTTDTTQTASGQKTWTSTQSFQTILPNLTTSYNLGSPSQSWDDGYFQNLLPPMSGSGSIGSGGIYWSTLYSNQVYTGQLNPASSTILVDAPLIPFTNLIYNLGSSTEKWLNLYVGNVGSQPQPANLFVAVAQIVNGGSIQVYNGSSYVNGVTKTCTSLPTVINGIVVSC